MLQPSAAMREWTSALAHFTIAALRASGRAATTALEVSAVADLGWLLVVGALVVEARPADKVGVLVAPANLDRAHVGACLDGFAVLRA